MPSSGVARSTIFYFYCDVFKTSSPSLFSCTSATLSREEAVLHTITKHFIFQFNLSSLIHNNTNSPLLSKDSKFLNSCLVPPLRGSLQENQRSSRRGRLLFRSQTHYPAKAGSPHLHPSGYSLRKAATGFAIAAFMAWKLTVARVSNKAPIAAIINIHQEISVR